MGAGVQGNLIPGSWEVSLQQEGWRLVVWVRGEAKGRVAVRQLARSTGAVRDFETEGTDGTGLCGTQ